MHHYKGSARTYFENAERYEIFFSPKSTSPEPEKHFGKRHPRIRILGQTPWKTRTNLIFPTSAPSIGKPQTHADLIYADLPGTLPPMKFPRKITIPADYTDETETPAFAYKRIPQKSSFVV